MTGAGIGAIAEGAAWAGQIAAETSRNVRLGVKRRVPEITAMARHTGQSLVESARDTAKSISP